MTLHACNIVFGYPGSTAVIRGATVELEAGRFLCLLGPNGAGKSTLLRLLAGLHLPTRGDVTLEGKRITAMRTTERVRSIGFLPQEVRPAFHFRADEAVALGRRAAADHESVDDAVAAALARVDATNLAARPLGELSGGERRRVLIASVLAQEPKHLLLDEPTAMLDLEHQVALFRHFKELVSQGLGVLCATHDFNLAAAFADELLLLSQGRILARGTPKEILTEANLRRLYGSGFRLVETGDAAPAVLPSSGERDR